MLCGAFIYHFDINSDLLFAIDDEDDDGDGSKD